MDKIQYRVAGSEWETLADERDDDTIAFAMDDRDIDYITYDGEVPYVAGVRGKVEYRRVREEVSE